MDWTINVVKTTMLISCVFTGQLICTFVFAYAKSRFSRDRAHKMSPQHQKTYLEGFQPGPCHKWYMSYELLKSYLKQW